MAPTPPLSPFDRLGPWPPAGPVVLAVPHAGRIYPPPLVQAAALPVRRLAVLEDRFADRLIPDAVAAGATAIVARHARAWIDLNRDEREIDPAMLDAPPPAGLMATAKMRGGLGLIPRRIDGNTEIWGRRLPIGAIEERIAQDHRPYHAAIAEALAAAHARFGVAILLDCHSMPPLARTGGRQPPRLVIGDRHGRSAADRFVDRIAALAERAALPSARNAPYAGGYTLDRHGDPQRGIHAIQVEFDRSLYLEPDLRTPSAGTARIAAFLAGIVRALADEALTVPPALAAE